LVSDTGYYDMNFTGEHYHALTHPFPGTVVCVVFRTDDVKSYALASETTPVDLF
jgi:hypothetical protein